VLSPRWHQGHDTITQRGGDSSLGPSGCFFHDFPAGDDGVFFQFAPEALFRKGFPVLVLLVHNVVIRITKVPGLGDSPRWFTGPSGQRSAREYLPNADIVFDRFHVIKNYSKALSNQRRIEFRTASKAGKELLTETHYLVLKNAAKLAESQTQKLQQLLDENANLNTLYILKEQLQTLWE
jgi:hypothetical protein